MSIKKNDLNSANLGKERSDRVGPLLAKCRRNQVHAWLDSSRRLTRKSPAFSCEQNEYHSSIYALKLARSKNDPQQSGAFYPLGMTTRIHRALTTTQARSPR